MAKDPRPDTATTLAPPSDTKTPESIDIIDQEKQSPLVDGEDEFPNGGLRAWATVGGVYAPLSLSLHAAYNGKTDSWSNSVDLGTPTFPSLPSPQN
jgi:hypothetical protein